MKLLLLVLFASGCSLAALGQSSTETTDLPSGVCRSIDNCALYDGTELAAWVSNDFVQVPETGTCSDITNRQYTSSGTAPRQVGDRSNFVFNLTCQGDDYVLSIQETGYAYYARGSGRAGSGVRYYIASGTKTISH